MRGLETECFAGALVELILSVSMLCDAIADSRSFGAVLANETDGIFDGAFFPGVIGMAEERSRASGRGNGFVAGKLTSVVIGDGEGLKAS